MADKPEPIEPRYRRLPDRVPPERWVEEEPSEAPHDPNGGRDPETEWMLRNTGG